jgi:hypothetical protein
MKERYSLERELEALGVRSPIQLEKEIKRSGQIGLREFFGPTLAPRPLAPSAFSTLGFEFDLNFGFEIEVANAIGSPPPVGGFNFPSEGLKATDHEWEDGGGKLKEGFVVTMDAVRMEISTVPLGLNNDKDYNIVKNNVKKFGEELISARMRGKFNSHVNVPHVSGHPTTFEHPRTVVNKPDTDPHSPCLGNVQFPGDRKHATYKLARVPLVIARVRKKYPPRGYTKLWSAPQATLTLPLARFVKLVDEIHQTRGRAPGVAFTGGGRGGDKHGRDIDRLGLRDDLAKLAQDAAMNDRKRKIGTKLSDGTKVTDKDLPSITSLVTILVMYMLTSIKIDDRDSEEGFAKASLPLNVKTPLWQIHKFALNDRERLILHELYTDPGKRQNLFALASGGTIVNGTKKLFPARTHGNTAQFLPVPTWDDLVDALVLEKEVEVTVDNCIEKKGHRKGDKILIAPLTSKIDWNKTKPLIAIEMRRSGFAPVFFDRWLPLMDRIRKLAKKVNESWI